eukprot:CAMPEP_0178951446 /NCGR_PEP_ID=MMETSP0789-20121207/7235_1 /TAXON_ID=3005 /ORGANISM="Rhizosolenia setigera, Strain CCMP 1694" /LENGTH=812 /DNA_ID=CAMNT_0020632329 /DNA_START=302 /DNA_END=2740 /DNA_ORIENTATION=+
MNDSESSSGNIVDTDALCGGGGSPCQQNNIFPTTTPLKRSSSSSSSCRGDDSNDGFRIPPSTGGGAASHHDFGSVLGSSTSTRSSSNKELHHVSNNLSSHSSPISKFSLSGNIMGDHPRSADRDHLMDSPFGCASFSSPIPNSLFMFSPPPPTTTGALSSHTKKPPRASDGGGGLSKQISMTPLDSSKSSRRHTIGGANSQQHGPPYHPHHYGGTNDHYSHHHLPPLPNMPHQYGPSSTSSSSSSYNHLPPLTNSTNTSSNSNGEHGGVSGTHLPMSYYRPYNYAVSSHPAHAPPHSHHHPHHHPHYGGPPHSHHPHSHAHHQHHGPPLPPPSSSRQDGSSNRRPFRSIGNTLLSENNGTGARKKPSSSSTNQPTYRRKDKSLGLLCDNFLTRYGGETLLQFPSSQSDLDDSFSFQKDSCISIDTAASDLSVERRRIYDIINILESIHIVSRKCKNTYNWHGTKHLPSTLSKLQRIAVETWEDDSKRFLGSAIAQKTNDVEEARRELGVKKLKSLGKLSQEFVQLFLAGNEIVNLNDATEKIVGVGPTAAASQDSGNAKSVNEKAESSKSASSSSTCWMKTKSRRLYDIANVLASVGIIAKLTANDGNSSGMSSNSTKGANSKNRGSFKWVYEISPRDLPQHWNAKEGNLFVPGAVDDSLLLNSSHDDDDEEEESTSESDRSVDEGEQDEERNDSHTERRQNHSQVPLQQDSCEKEERMPSLPTKPTSPPFHCINTTIHNDNNNNSNNNKRKLMNMECNTLHRQPPQAAPLPPLETSTSPPSVSDSNNTNASFAGLFSPVLKKKRKSVVMPI